VSEMTDRLFELERDLGPAARRVLLAGPEMDVAYPARLAVRLRSAADAGRAPQRWWSIDLARGALARLGAAAALAIVLSLAGAGVLLNDAPSADARQLVTRIVQANEAGTLTSVPPGMVRHVTVVTTSSGATPALYEEWSGDEGRSVRLLFADGTILTVTDAVGWMYDPQQNVARRVDLSQKRFEALGLGRFALTAPTVTDAEARIVGRAVALGRPATVVELATKPIDQNGTDSPKKSTAVRMRYQLVVDDTTFEIRESRAASLDSVGAVIDEVVTRVTMDELVDASRFAPDYFRFTPPPGTTLGSE
jgi:hypothetical protein